MKIEAKSTANRNLGFALVVCFVVQAGIVAFLFLQSRTKAANVAYVDTAILIAEFNEAKNARTELEKYNQDWQEKAKSIKDSMDLFMKKMGSDYNNATSARKEELRSEMQSRNQEMERYMMANQKKAFDKEKELMDPVLKKINIFMKEYADKNGYDLIFGSTTSGNIMAGGSRLNITGAILEGINKQYP